ncbi:putative disease resistance protein RGA3 [Panicum virgatum]|uniref:NB-ARC domain-containing protein n=1 Tax=Panicum virgatum TaxID=38727 RepID=A0A8T0S2L0_PANVG|nr:putative disease resistance protein RGA3 [Panicum virgatum]KAG2591288.1 hypothetical protein PVAP13_5NG471200 [Panicum virgatum]
METIASAILGDLISRSVSFALDRCYHRWRSAGGIEDAPQRLRRVLLRLQAVVEEADRRRVTNQAMLRQLQLMREGVYRGYYLLSAIKRQGVPEVSSLRDRSSLASSLFNQAKRLCTVSARTTPASTAPEDTGRGREGEAKAKAKAELQEVLTGLERMASDMKELVVFLSCYPPARRVPHSGHLWLENSMFGREAEQEKIISFLLGPEPVGVDGPGVLPVIGRPRVGKSTLVEHVCLDERVRGHFSLIVFFSQGDIEDGNLSPHLGDNGTIKHRDLDPAGKSLVVIELAGDVDEQTWWGRTLFALRGRRTTPVSKIIVTSRSEKIASFGTTQALELKSLPREAYWYFFKTIAFGSMGAEDQPELESVCMEMADLLNRCFISANLFGCLLRANPCYQFWRRVLNGNRQYIRMHFLRFGDHPCDLLLMNGRPIYLWRLPKTDTVVTAYHTYQTCSSQEHDVPKITLNELQVGSARPRGKFEVVAWKSRIPPYYSYVLSCRVHCRRSSVCPPMNKQIQHRQPRLNSV